MSIKRVVDLQDLLFTTERMQTKLREEYYENVLIVVEELNGVRMAEDVTLLKNEYYQNMHTLEQFVRLYKECEGPFPKKQKEEKIHEHL
jgi:hypothetical protein